MKKFSLAAFVLLYVSVNGDCICISVYFCRNFFYCC